MDHSYEEIRSVALDILAGREKAHYDLSQYEHFKIAVADVFERRGIQKRSQYQTYPMLSKVDSEIFREIFWDLFLQRTITLGCDDANREFPFFKVSSFGKKFLEGQEGYFFHDMSSYEKCIVDEIPQINEVTLLYLKEAMQAFQSGCILSATVMLGVATEHTFLLLLDTIEQNPAHKQTFSSAFKEKTVLQKVNKFKNKLDQQINFLPSEIKEDLDTHFSGILSVIRTFRNQSGHPTGKIIDREQTYVLLHLFISYCKKMYQLMDHFK